MPVLRLTAIALPDLLIRSKLLMYAEAIAMPSNLPIDPTLYLLLNLHCLLGGIAAVVAAKKGYSLGRWLLWGLVGGTGALIVAVVMPLKQATSATPNLPRRLK